MGYVLLRVSAGFSSWLVTENGNKYTVQIFVVVVVYIYWIFVCLSV